MVQPAIIPQPDVEQVESDYDKWFREQVEEGMREADDPKTVWYSNDEVMKHVDERLRYWEEKASQRKAS